MLIDIKEARKHLQQENRKYSIYEIDWIDESHWPTKCYFDTQRPIKFGRSKDYAVQVYAEKDGALRLSINRTKIDKRGNWVDGMTWDELMRVKTMAGYGHCWAVEVYPPLRHVVNVANMRHLWIAESLPENIGWR